MERDLRRLAAAHGVVTAYDAADGRRTQVDRDIVVRVLGLLDVDATSPAAIRTALAAATTDRGLPPTIVVREGDRRDLRGTVTLEDGTTREVTELAGLPLGWHRLTVDHQQATLVVAPRRLPPPPAAWGWMVQLYALRSRTSWGMGDLGDLREFAGWAAGTGAGLVLLNPLHAIGPNHPVQASPYSPSSRRFANPLYIRVTDTVEYLQADPGLQAKVDALRPDDGELIDYDAVWTAKRTALELLYPGPQPADDPGLTAFATYCVLAEEHGTDWRQWPAGLRSPGNATADPRRVGFYVWLQRLCDQQLATAAEAARDMPVGIVHDLAVGVDPGGADGWQLGDVLAQGVRVGAPPDAFNQLGQDWGLAAWRPDRLAATGYAAYRDMLRALLRHGGGLRVDHVAGLSRLWWIPPGAGAAEGTYVRYDADAMFGILALEAHRAGAVVVGEDLGTVQPSVTRALRGRNMLGSTVLWFTRDGEAFVPPRAWPRTALATISTHDLPTAKGFLTEEHVRVRSRLGLLATGEDAERSRARADRQALIAMLRDAGLLSEEDDDSIVTAMHAALAASPARLITASLYDVLGETRQPNLPGTTDQYPNWRLPLPLSREEIQEHPGARATARLLAAARPPRRRD
ncbi:4-alpha-glucanotransferase [Asanoa hainanensis]|uniref:4-alpha-glucanotransferase n=1 Tax=Asanoa hainanensis TaxID=560556 RepID=A0A239GFF0_9ACTN|nr:4-alpha-glucanotransferase [Asanoa hainanensis]SNS67870.1 4-alpha-glucanotransferase [Asanoa hainanensis]